MAGEKGKYTELLTTKDGIEILPGERGLGCNYNGFHIIDDGQHIESECDYCEYSRCCGNSWRREDCEECPEERCLRSPRHIFPPL